MTDVQTGKLNIIDGRDPALLISLELSAAFDNLTKRTLISNLGRVLGVRDSHKMSRVVFVRT